ncbi:replication endonuclease [Comamonas sp. Y33R10-2]|uniref:replication endonuclease n=1 Tax=Comamonas sp. Y33R10-2 TaxID=2853257 RepID=UPI001C5CB3DB|nr:replication endonuclease [Comamonas sp. Y33R10-2]QXZ10953.1 replication endonuclease [Comamonas sp. Y33R10-2]
MRVQHSDEKPVTYEQWAGGRAADRLDRLGLPKRWQARLMRNWARIHRTDRPESEQFLRKYVADLGKTRISLDASDWEITDKAMGLALRCAERATLVHEENALLASMKRVCEGQGIQAPRVKRCSDIPGALARMCCPIWWRRKLRSHHGRCIESTAISLGYVNRSEEIYCSNETVYRIRQRDKAAAEMLATTFARNEHGQELSLEELRKVSVAERSIKRAELMTRISGFERVAVAAGHGGLFMTTTCPSRMHKWRTVGPKHSKKVVENSRYDGTEPRQAQEHLADVWARTRSALLRYGVALYGFRIAEPNHDGTPHWHFLVFFDLKWPGEAKRAALPRIKAICRRYALGRGEARMPAFKKMFTERMVPYRTKKAAKAAAAMAETAWRIADRRNQNSEPGAKVHRVDFEEMDSAKGSAAGYIAKYVAKNIDGYNVGEDLFGNPAMETSGRVESWARTWGIRQFQQVGGPPVTVWRELRRIEELPKGAPAHLVMAFNAVNKVELIEGRENASVAWDRYCEAQGGVFCGRLYSIRLDMQEQEGLNRYGEEKGKRPVGVYTSGIEEWTPPWMAHMSPPALIPRRVEWFVESSRHVWEIVGRPRPAVLSAPCAPWTCVNNCTGEIEDGVARANEGGEGGMGEGSGACQIDGWEVHGASLDRDRVAMPALPLWGWKKNHPDYLQGHELQQWWEQWKWRNMYGPWQPASKVAVSGGKP